MQLRQLLGILTGSLGSDPLLVDAQQKLELGFLKMLSSRPHHVILRKMFQAVYVLSCVSF